MSLFLEILPIVAQFFWLVKSKTGGFCIFFALQLVDKILEKSASFLKISESIEACRGGREQNHVAFLGNAMGDFNRFGIVFGYENFG